LVFTKPVRF